MRARIRFIIIHSFILLAGMAVPAASFANPLKWNINKSLSEISFTTLYGETPMQGTFNDYTATILFSPHALENSRAEIRIRTASIQSDSADVVKYLPKPLWFAAEAFPEAVFQAETFTHIKGDQYAAAGTLTLKNIKKPVVLSFTFTDTEAGNITTAQVKGHARIKRSDFNVGEGEWQDTGIIADAVDISFHLTATVLP